MVIHILKNGTILSDITGHVVTEHDAPLAYNIIDQMNESRKIKKGSEHEKNRFASKT